MLTNQEKEHLIKQAHKIMEVTRQGFKINYAYYFQEHKI